MKKSVLALAFGAAMLAPLAAANAQVVDLSNIALNPTNLAAGAIGTANPSENINGTSYIGSPGINPITTPVISPGVTLVNDYYFELSSPASISTSLLGDISSYSVSSAIYATLSPLTPVLTTLGASGLTSTSSSPTSVTYNLTPGVEYTLAVTGTSGSGFDANITAASPAVSAAPEPATWALMVFGIGAIGMAMRRSRRPARDLLAAA